MAKVNLLLKPSSVTSQKAVFLGFMVIHTRKPENEGTTFRE